jgi:hypothetical protein
VAADKAGYSGEKYAIGHTILRAIERTI